MRQRRLTLNGPAAQIAAAGRLLELLGARPTSGDTTGFILRSARGDGLLSTLARRYPGLTIGVESFEILGAELKSAVVDADGTTVLHTRALRPRIYGGADDDLDGDLDVLIGDLSDWGVVIDEDGERLDPRAVARAAAAVGAVAAIESPLPHLDAAARVSCALGDLCSDDAEPRPELRGRDVASIAALALTIAAGPGTCSAAEMGWTRDLVLTQANAHACAEPRWESMDATEWWCWLTQSSTDLIQACCDCHVRDTSPTPWPANEMYDEHEQRRRGAGSLVVTALQAMVLLDLLG